MLDFAILSGMGRRPANEDAVHAAVNGAGGLFLVCDGVGGSRGGGLASRLAVEAVAACFEGQDTAATATDAQGAVHAAHAAILSAAGASPENGGMGTTLALLHVQGSDFAAAHVGDSRVYHIRGNRILFQTRDHSFVNELVDSGFISEAEAQRHPRRNLITRVIRDREETVAPEFHVFSGVRTGDYFLLATDGIGEGIPDLAAFVRTAFGAAEGPAGILQKMEGLCLRGAGDNYSAILIRYAAH